MKKVIFAMIAVLAIAFTGCKVEDATVTVNVYDTAGTPVANRAVFYIDKASYIVGAVLPPSPTELMTGLDESGWQYVVTNKMGTVTFTIPMAVAKAKFYFLVFDEGSNQWVGANKEYELQRGKNEEINFEVNR